MSDSDRSTDLCKEADVAIEVDVGKLDIAGIYTDNSALNTGTINFCVEMSPFADEDENHQKLELIEQYLCGYVVLVMMVHQSSQKDIGRFLNDATKSMPDLELDLDDMFWNGVNIS